MSNYPKDDEAGPMTVAQELDAASRPLLHFSWRHDLDEQPAAPQPRIAADEFWERLGL